MSQHTRDDQALYHRPVSLLWWTRKRTYFVFVMRELSSIFIAWLILYLLLFVRAVADGPEAYDTFLDRASSPWLVVVNVVAFAFVLLHTATWFLLTPQAMDLRVRGRRLPAAAIVGAQYAGLAVVSLRAVSGGSWSRVASATLAAAWVIATLYGVSDEIHQAFVPLRTPDVRDVIADATGAALALGAAWAWSIIRRSP